MDPDQLAPLRERKLSLGDVVIGSLKGKTDITYPMIVMSIGRGPNTWYGAFSLATFQCTISTNNLLGLEVVLESVYDEVEIVPRAEIKVTRTGGEQLNGDRTLF